MLILGGARGGVLALGEAIEHLGELGTRTLATADLHCGSRAALRAAMSARLHARLCAVDAVRLALYLRVLRHARWAVLRE